jgi:prepilin-type N-terminal cleavage/methylation domain-containing protein
MTIKRDSGFSLVEVMIVIAVIGILSAIAIPNYVKQVNLRKQAQAKANLVGLITAEKSFIAQFGIVTSRLDEVGWHPSGAQSYYYGFTGDYPPAGVVPSPPYNPADGTCFDTYKNVGTCIAGFALKWQNGSEVLGASPFSSASFPSATAWLAYARGNLGNAVDDEWSINSQGALTNTSNGF